MGINLIPESIRERFQIEERRHACAILANDHPAEFADLMGCLEQFTLLRSEIVTLGGSKTRIAGRFDNYLYSRGWRAKSTAIEMIVDSEPRRVETHSIDLCKGRVACEVQWKSKDRAFSRAPRTLRELHKWDVISVGVIVVRCDELESKVWSKLMRRVNADDGGVCP